MDKEIREIYYDQDIQVEAYQLKGILQSFPMHFHEYYVIGFIDKGKRHMKCKQGEFDLQQHDIILFNPYDQHQCAPIENSFLEYRAINVPTSTMKALCCDIIDNDSLPVFQCNVIQDEECLYYLESLYTMITQQSDPFEKEEFLILLLTRLLQTYTSHFVLEEKQEHIHLSQACSYMKDHMQERIEMKELCELCAMSPSTLLRSFTKAYGVTPYRYLEMLRLQHAKSLLEKGATILDAAITSGFCDQSHFTNFFHTFIGISPGAYRDIFVKGRNI